MWAKNHKCTQMYLFIKERVCDNLSTTEQNRKGILKLVLRPKGLARVIKLMNKKTFIVFTATRSFVYVEYV